MFIERSSARIRAVRTLFVLLGLIPCACLCGWAVLRHSAGHRHAIERRCAQLLGLPVRIAGVEHVRPDAVRLRDCVLASPAGDALFTVPLVEVESSATEIRVRLGRAVCSPQSARVLAGLADQWLRQPARFPQNCVVHVDEFGWSTDPADASLAGLRVECVAVDGSRAVRLCRGEPAGTAASSDEIRVVVAAADGRSRGRGRPADRLEVTGSVASPVPIAILEACIGLDAGAFPCGADAVVSGATEAVCEDGRWSGTARGRLDRVDLATASSHLPHRLSGEASFVVDAVTWSRGRITNCDGRFAVVRGGVEQRLLDALVSVIGCRPGPAYRPAYGEQVRGFDEAVGRLRIGAAGVDLRAAPERGAAIALSRGIAILEEPPGAVPLERLAWLLSTPAAAAVPASPATAWLLGLFSDEILATPAGGPGSGRGTAEQAGRPTRRSDF